MTWLGSISDEELEQCRQYLGEMDQSDPRLPAVAKLLIKVVTEIEHREWDALPDDHPEKWLHYRY